MNKKLVFATHNRGKLREMYQLLDLPDIEFLCLDDLDIPNIRETGSTFAENARLKAEGVMLATKLPCLADDSGLEVDALGGQPGIYSARYAGPNATSDENVDLLLYNMRHIGYHHRWARFKCVIAYADPRFLGHIEFKSGKCSGMILNERRGLNGFGFDPVFFSCALGKTFAQATSEEKNMVSHRALAMRKMADYLKGIMR